jgi:glucose/arabinose dehydrogenase
VSTTDPDVAVGTSDETILTISHSYDEHHNGGQLQFGPDGMLYLSVGDGGGSGDPLDSGQDPSDMLGNILRINVSGASGYTIPIGNPFANNPVWSYGLRNPWRFSFDRSNGDLYIGDVGQGLREEIDVAPNSAGRGKGANFGWSIMEGNSCYEASSCDPSGLILPVVDYSHANNNTAVIGGYVYRGNDIPGIRGRYFYSDLTGRWLHSFVYAGGRATDPIDWNLTLPDGALSFGEDGHGELYVMTDGGQVFRLSP